MARTKAYPTKERILEVLNYDELTGIFTWKRPAANSVYPVGSVAGSINTFGYVRIYFDGNSYAAHRLAWICVYGELSGLVEVDHIDTDRSNNRISNLRLATTNQNMHNRRLNSNSKSGVKGVVWEKESEQWRARCRMNGKSYSVGRFEHLEEAAHAVKVFREKLHKEFANHG